MQASRSPSPTMSNITETALTYDEVSMHRSRHFVMALQELKNLRPQLHSAAEYCESSYLYSEQKQAVLENLKDYSVKALVNAVDHLGTVACKLNDLLDQQTSEIASTEMRVASISQRLRTCQEYTDREALKQQSLSKTYPRHHKHYSIPETGDADALKTAAPDLTKNEDSSRQIPDRNLQSNLDAKSDASKNGTPTRAVASEFKSGSPQPARSNGMIIGSSSSEAFSRDTFSASPKGKASTGTPRQTRIQGLPAEESKSLSSLMSTDGDRPPKELRPVPSRSKSMFMSLLGKTKSLKTSKNNA